MSLLHEIKEAVYPSVPPSLSEELARRAQRATQQRIALRTLSAVNRRSDTQILESLLEQIEAFSAAAHSDSPRLRAAALAQLQQSADRARAERRAR